MIWSFQHQVQPFLVKYNRSYSQGAISPQPVFLEGFNLLNIEIVWSR